MGNESENTEAMSWPDEMLTDARVRYILDLDGKLLVFENVPARVNFSTGEQFFAPATVRQIQQLAMSATKPVRTIQATGYEFAA